MKKEDELKDSETLDWETMLDIKFIREQTETVRHGILRKGEDVSLVDEALALDAQRRQILQKGEALKSQKNVVSGQVAARKAKKEDAAELITQMRAVADEIKSLDDALRDVEARLHTAASSDSQYPSSDRSRRQNPGGQQTIFEWGERPVIDFPPKPHWELVEHAPPGRLRPRNEDHRGGISRVHRERVRKLERALINFFLDEAVARGYTEMSPPLADQFRQRHRDRPTAGQRRSDVRRDR